MVDEKEKVDWREIFRKPEDDKMVDENNPELDILKSALQKYVRRGNYEKAAYFGLKLAEKNWWSFWRRASVIAVEDCLVPETVNAVGELYRMFMMSRRIRNAKDSDVKMTWDEKRLVVAACFILATSKKNRFADEFLDILDKAEKGQERAKHYVEEISKVDDFVIDMHTKEGRRRGIKWDDDRFWVEHSSVTENKTEQYEKWRKWYEWLVLGGDIFE